MNMEKFALIFLTVYILLELGKYVFNRYIPILTEQYAEGNGMLATICFILFVIVLVGVLTTCFMGIWLYIHKPN